MNITFQNEPNPVDFVVDFTQLAKAMQKLQSGQSFVVDDPYGFITHGTLSHAKNTSHLKFKGLYHCVHNPTTKTTQVWNEQGIFGQIGYGKKGKAQFVTTNPFVSITK